MNTHEKEHCEAVASAWLQDRAETSLAELLQNERAAVRMGLARALQPVLDFRTILVQGRRYAAVSDLREALQGTSR